MSKIKQFIIEMIEITIGAMLMAVSTGLLLLPNQLSSGGFTGIATILYYFLKIPVGVAILAMNIPMFIFSYFKVGRKFVIYSLIGTALYSIFIDLLENVQPLTEDGFLACIYGGILMGLRNSYNIKSKWFNRRLRLSK